MENFEPFENIKPEDIKAIKDISKSIESDKPILKIWEEVKEQLEKLRI